MESIHTYLARIKKKCLKTSYRGYDFFMNTDKYIRYTHATNGFNNANYQFDKPQIAFVHLPKSGGTSFNKMLKEDTESRFVNLGIHKPVSKTCKASEYKYVTIIRNPIDRVWSQYQMVLRSPKGYPYQKFAKQGLSVFLEKCWLVRNINCRYLTGEIDAEPDDETLKQSITNLANFYAVLAFENFSDQIITFMEKHKIPFETIPNERKSSYPGPTDEEIELIKKYNQLDIRLFEEWKAKRETLKKEDD